VGYDARMFGVDTVIVLVIVLVVVLVWRGPKMLPKWGETLGRGVKATKKEVTDLQDDIRKRDDEAPPPSA
jgi:Sec-independent protein translocase protein TatA